MTKLFFDMMKDDELTAFEKCLCRFIYLFDNDEQKEGLEMDYICQTFLEKCQIKREVMERVLESLLYKGQIYTTVNEYTFRFIGSKITAARKHAAAMARRAAREAQEKKDIEDAVYDIGDSVTDIEVGASPFGIGTNPKPKPKASKGAKVGE